MKDNKRIAVFFDTNIFHHYQPIGQIKWLEVLGADIDIVVIASVVMRELDKHKDDYSKTRIRNRARAAINLLESAIVSEVPIIDELNARVQLLHHPDKEYFTGGLSEGNPDDELVAACLMFRDANPDCEIFLIAHDSGPRIKALQKGIRVERIPDEYRLADEIDAETKEIQRLKKQIVVLENRMPKLELQFERGSSVLVHSLSEPFTLSADEIENQIESRKREVPSLIAWYEFLEKGDDSLESLTRLVSEYGSKLEELGKLSHIPSRFEVESYEEERVRYFDEYKRHLELQAEMRNLHQLTVKINLDLLNSGTSPASDIDLSLHFPDGFELCNERDYPEALSEPVAPQFPGRFWNGMGIPRFDFDNLNEILMQSPFDKQSNVSRANIHRTNSYDVDLKIGRLKQKQREQIESLYAVFDSYEIAKSFSIDYRINCVELPEEVEGKLHIVVER